MVVMRGLRERRIKYYSSVHDILLVGEGDFSFSLCLAMAFASATNIVATSLDTYDQLLMKYHDAYENLAFLQALGATLLHGVDATEISIFHDLGWKKFHRIIFNFPHAGFFGRENDPQLIMKHRNLVRGFLMNASNMLWPDGEIHINHKTEAPYDQWKIKDLAPECSLFFVGVNEFSIKDYPGYQNKRGSGPTPDGSFRLGLCGTFKFKLYPSAGQIGMELDSVQAKSKVNHMNECHRIFGGYLHRVEETFGSTSYDVSESVREALRLGLGTYMGAVPGRPLTGYIGVLEELHNLSILRSERLRRMLLVVDQQHPASGRGT